MCIYDVDVLSWPTLVHAHAIVSYIIYGEFKYCEDTRPQNQLNAAKEQHKGLGNILQKASVTLHIILLGVGGTIYNIHTLKPFKEPLATLT